MGNVTVPLALCLHFGANICVNQLLTEKSKLLAI